MSAILSADDLNDFISPGVACTKPVESLPRQQPHPSSAYEVAKEGQLPEDAKAAQISLTDCLACSGCVTSAEAVLVSLQSHSEVLNALDTEERLFVASVSPQVRASIGATYGVSELHAGWMIDQLLRGPRGLAMGGTHGSHFKWVVDTNAMREASLVLAAGEVAQSLSASELDTLQKRPILTSACPGWICYAEKSHAHVLPHLSRLKSPQALSGILLKTILSKQLHLRPEQIWHVAIMPCFDKKLEASREELTDSYWHSSFSEKTTPPIRDVDCVITARELLMLADTRGISFPSLPRQPLPISPFPDPTLHSFLFPRAPQRRQQPREAGTSGGYLHHILQTQLSIHPHSTLASNRGYNADVIEYTITSPGQGREHIHFKAARYYGFRNIQNLVRKLKPAKKSRMPGARPSKLGPKATSGANNLDGYTYVEVMACPGGCTNGGGQIKIEDLPGQSRNEKSQKEWLESVDEAYFSMSEEEGVADETGEDSTMVDINDEERRYDDEVNGVSPSYIRYMLKHWENMTEIPLEKLVQTSYREVKSDVGNVGEPDPTSRFMAF